VGRQEALLGGGGGGGGGGGERARAGREAEAEAGGRRGEDGGGRGEEGAGVEGGDAGRGQGGGRLHGVTLGEQAELRRSGAGTVRRADKPGGRGFGLARVASTAGFILCFYSSNLLSPFFKRKTCFSSKAKQCKF
jgi:hypothetical protein